jgi:hypothetical protein
MLPGVGDNTARSFKSQAREDLGRQFLKRDAGLGVIDHAVRQDARADNCPLAGNAAWNSLYVGAFAPVDHVGLYTAPSPAQPGASDSSCALIYSIECPVHVTWLAHDQKQPVL